jgi:sugar phosphate isomerase/epimerase
MTDRVLLSAGLHNFEQCVALALKHNLGIEVMAFAFPHILDGDWQEVMDYYKIALADISGPITMHGPFMDMVSGSPDERVNAVTYHRYAQALQIATHLGAKQVVFHANYIGLLHNEFYRTGWHQRNVDFWGPLGDYAQEHDVIVAIENMWEYDPTIIGNLLKELDHPYLKACLDVGHAHLFSDRNFQFSYWLETLDDYIIELHMNNNNGIMDEHHGFDWEQGALNYSDLMPKLRELSVKPDMVLEMDQVEDMKDSLHHFKLVEPA